MSLLHIGADVARRKNAWQFQAGNGGKTPVNSYIKVSGLLAMILNLVDLSFKKFAQHLVNVEVIYAHEMQEAYENSFTSHSLFY